MTSLQEAPQDSGPAQVNLFRPGVYVQKIMKKPPPMSFGRVLDWRIVFLLTDGSELGSSGELSTLLLIFRLPG